MSAGWAAVMIAALIAACTALAWLVRWSMRWAILEQRLITALDQIRDDRRATNERLTYLERSVWPRARNSPSTGS